MRTIAICFGQFGPYHHARVAALQREVKDQKTKRLRGQETRVVPIQIAAATSTYEWRGVQGTAGLKDQETKRPEDQATNAVASPPRAEDLRTLCEGVEEAASPLEVFLKARTLFRQEKVKVAFLPSYSPARYFALFAAAKSLGIRTVMMNESHAGTEQAAGWKRWIKRQIVRRFDAALVGGEPHKRHFASLGIPADKIFTGYDAVDNALFAAKADEVRKKSDEWRVTCDELGKQSESQNVREAYGLPERYFLSLGRMVEKKNLATLVSAYARYVQSVAVAGKRLKVKGNDGKKRGDMLGGAASPSQAEGSEVVTSHQLPATRYSVPALVFVGSGELEGALREQARALGLRIVDRTDWKAGESSHSRVFETAEGKLTRMNTDKSERLAADQTQENAAGSVIAYGPSAATGPPVRAGCRLSPESTGGEDAAAMETRDSLLATRDEENRGTVFFYGFRQIEENPVFYALAEAFVLPSLKEEWGLVVNEAMACSLPVIVSRTAGCAEDLLPGSEQVTSDGCRVTSRDPDDCKPVTLNSLEERSNGFVFDPRSSDALSEALRRIADQETNSRVFETARGRAEGKLKGQETDGLTEMGKRSREIVATYSCENFAQQALRAAEAASA